MSSGVYALGSGGTVEVTYCSARAISFRVGLPAGPEQVAPLMMSFGLTPAALAAGGLALTEDAPAHKEWAAADPALGGLARVVASATPKGWTSLIVDVALAC